MEAISRCDKYPLDKLDAAQEALTEVIEGLESEATLWRVREMSRTTCEMRVSNRVEEILWFPLDER
jgi:hypothetical protein